MANTLGKWMTLVIVANIMFAPILSYIDSLHREAVEVVLQEGAKKAAIEGGFNRGIMDDMKEHLVEHYSFDADEITITTNTPGTVLRNNYIEATISVPRGPIFLFDIFDPGTESIRKNTRVLSEYVN